MFVIELKDRCILYVVQTPSEVNQLLKIKPKNITSDDFNIRKLSRLTKEFPIVAVEFFDTKTKKRTYKYCTPDRVQSVVNQYKTTNKCKTSFYYIEETWNPDLKYQCGPWVDYMGRMPHYHSDNEQQ